MRIRRTVAEIPSTGRPPTDNWPNAEKRSISERTLQYRGSPCASNPGCGVFSRTAERARRWFSWVDGIYSRHRHAAGRHLGDCERRTQATLPECTLKNILRVGGHPHRSLENPNLLESLVLTDGSSAGSNFLLIGLACRVRALSDARHDNLIEPVMNIARWHQIPHCRLQRFVPHPMLNRTHIEARSEHARGIGRAEGLQIKLL